ncbi:hypothetical protein Tsp_16059 [Trichinella spiralis]|uniref:hypothetical protein n=1 Tax=Trichinella spiralis TaxID=6334 RepID=UPI0001EFDB0C|nr:hypothetical protein Tsp_16059 [Trichinella spiralis]
MPINDNMRCAPCHRFCPNRYETISFQSSKGFQRSFANPRHIPNLRVKLPDFVVQVPRARVLPRFQGWIHSYPAGMLVSIIILSEKRRNRRCSKCAGLHVNVFMNWENERSRTKCCFCGQVIEMLAVLVHKLMEHLNDRLIPR